MKHKFGILMIILGCGMLTAALALFLHNQQEQLSAASASQEVIVKVVEVIREEKKSEDPLPAAPQPTEISMPTATENREMSVVDIDGYGYIGFIGIPSLELELPVMTDWSYPQLRIAPCRYYGDLYSDDLVIVAHNYARHFGKLKDLRTGDLVTFTDMEGNTVEYCVMALEILNATAIEEMTSGDYDLTLFTCTYGGENRVTLRCDRNRN